MVGFPLHQPLGLPLGTAKIQRLGGSGLELWVYQNFQQEMGAKELRMEFPNRMKAIQEKQWVLCPIFGVKSPTRNESVLVNSPKSSN